MSATEDRKTCIDCEHFDTMPGNMYGVCFADTYEDGDGELRLQWMPYDATACNRFKEMEP